MSKKTNLHLLLGRGDDLKICLSKLKVGDKEIDPSLIGSKIMKSLQDMEGEHKKYVERKILPLCFATIYPYLEQYGVLDNDVFQAAATQAAIIGFYLRDWMYENNADVDLVELEDDKEVKIQKNELTLRELLVASQAQTGNIAYGVAVALERDLINEERALEILEVFENSKEKAQEILEIIKKAADKSLEKIKETEN